MQESQERGGGRGEEKVVFTTLCVRCLPASSSVNKESEPGGNTCLIRGGLWSQQWRAGGEQEQENRSIRGGEGELQR